MDRKALAKVKITVIKKLYHQDLIEKYVLPEKQDAYTPCYRFNVNDEFIVDSFEMPEKFCPWAWADIHRDIMLMLLNADVPISVEPGLIIATCTDGLRPVVFKLERI